MEYEEEIHSQHNMAHKVEVAENQTSPSTSVTKGRA